MDGVRGAWSWIVDFVEVLYLYMVELEQAFICIWSSWYRCLPLYGRVGTGEEQDK